MRLVSCSNCFKPVDKRNTSFTEGKIICHECKKKHTKELKKAFNFYVGSKN